MACAGLWLGMVTCRCERTSSGVVPWYPRRISSRRGLSAGFAGRTIGARLDSRWRDTINALPLPRSLCITPPLSPSSSWSLSCPPPSSPSCRRIVVACNSGVRDGGEALATSPRCTETPSYTPRVPSHSLALSFSISLSLCRALATCRSFTALTATPTCPLRRPLRPANVHLLLLPVRTRLAHTHARTRCAPRCRTRDTRRDYNPLAACPFSFFFPPVSRYSFGSSLDSRADPRRAEKSRGRVLSRQHRAEQRRYALRFAAIVFCFTCRARN